MRRVGWLAGFVVGLLWSAVTVSAGRVVWCGSWLCRCRGYAFGVSCPCRAGYRCGNDKNLGEWGRP